MKDIKGEVFKEGDLVYSKSRPDYGIYKVVLRKGELVLYRNSTLGALDELPDFEITHDRRVNWEEWEDIEFGGSRFPYIDPYCWLSTSKDKRPYFPIKVKEGKKNGSKL